jgi:hypothetical protein
MSLQWRRAAASIAHAACTLPVLALQPASCHAPCSLAILAAWQRNAQMLSLGLGFTALGCAPASLCPGLPVLTFMWMDLNRANDCRVPLKILLFWPWMTSL